MEIIPPVANLPVENPNLFTHPASRQAFMEALAEGDFRELVLFIEGQGVSLASLQPRILKSEISKCVPDPGQIQTVRISRQGKVIIVTSSISAASELLKLESIATIPVSVNIQLENITTKFLLHNIPQNVSCTEIAEEILETGLTPVEVRRFICKAECAA